MGLCDGCPRRAFCTEPCEQVKHALDSPDRGRVPRRITAEGRRDARLLLERSALLPPRARAFLHLYYQSGFAMQTIAEAFGVNRSNVSRSLRRSRSRLLVPRRRPRRPSPRQRPPVPPNPDRESHEGETA